MRFKDRLIKLGINKENIISIFSLFLVCLWPFINILNQNKQVVFNLSPVFLYVTLLFAIGLFLSMLGRIVFRTGFSRLVLTGSVGLVFLFSYSQLIGVLTKQGLIPLVIFGIPMHFTAMWTIVVVFICFLVWRKSHIFAVQYVFLVFFSIMTIIPLIEVLYYFNQNQNQNHEALNLTRKFKKHNNVYFLLMDAYARSDTLKEVTGFDNAPFLQALSKKGFYVARDSFSNYHFTLASLSSTFSMAYHKLPTNKNELINQRDNFNIPLQWNNAVVNIFRSNGYKFILAPSGRWSEIDCNGTEDLCLAPHANTEFIVKVISMTPLIKWIGKIKFPYLELDDVKKAVESFPNQSKFIFAHFAQVHDTVYNEDCSWRMSGDPMICSSATKNNYKNSVNCVNQKLLQFIDYLKINDPSAIIIIMADHGPTVVDEAENPEACTYWLKNFWDLEIKSHRDFRNTFGILMAIKLPSLSEGSDYIYDSISPVNLFRAIIAYLKDEKPEYIRDKSFILYEDKSQEGYEGYSIDKFRSLN